MGPLASWTFYWDRHDEGPHHHYYCYVFLIMIFSISCCSSLLFLSYSLLLLLLLLLLLSLLSLLSLSYIIIIIYYHYYPMITITIIVSCYYCHFLPLCYYCYYYCYYCCNPFDSDTWWYLLTSLISLVWDWNIPSGSFGIPQEMGPCWYKASSRWRKPWQPAVPENLRGKSTGTEILPSGKPT